MIKVKRYMVIYFQATMEEPIVIWLSGLQIPESYLIAHIQIACRLYTWPLDRSTQFTRVTKWISADEIEERPITVSLLYFRYKSLSLIEPFATFR